MMEAGTDVLSTATYFAHYNFMGVFRGAVVLQYAHYIQDYTVARSPST